jgi:hypothetical protein
LAGHPDTPDPWDLEILVKMGVKMDTYDRIWNLIIDEYIIALKSREGKGAKAEAVYGVLVALYACAERVEDMQKRIFANMEASIDTCTPELLKLKYRPFKRYRGSPAIDGRNYFSPDDGEAHETP